MKDLLFILILVCSLAMAWMMRRGHGHGGHVCVHGGHADAQELEQRKLPTDQLRRQRDELDRLIAAREQAQGAPIPGER